MTRLGWALVMEARKVKGGTTASPNLKDAIAIYRALKVETATFVMEARKRDEDARGAAKGGDTGGRQLATKTPKAVGANKNKEEGLLARLSASRPPLSLLEGGGVGRRLALAGRRL